jgi:hypothetical protein
MAPRPGGAYHGGMSKERSADPTDELTTNEAIEAFIEAAAETGDIVYQVDCEQIAARARKRWGLGDDNARCAIIPFDVLR